MGGLLVLAVVAVYVWGAARLFMRAGNSWAKVLVVIAAVLIPTADAVYGRIRLKQMCDAEGGLRIDRVVQNVYGFDDPSGPPIDEWIVKYGYRFVEGKELGGERSRLSLQADGKIARSVGIAPISEYIYHARKGDARDTFLRIESRVAVRKTGEVLSRETNISYAGGWFERLVNGLFAARGTAGTCGPSVPMSELVTKTLMPIDQEAKK